jgi:hypothetical protein
VVAVLLGKSHLPGKHVEIANRAAVASVACWDLPCGVARLLSRRHVLLADIHYGCEYHYLHSHSKLTMERTLPRFSVCIRVVGTILDPVTLRICESLAS